MGGEMSERENSEVDIQKAIKEIQSGQATLLDVREEDEWEESRFCGAISFPLSLLREGERPDLPEGMPVYVHCMKGRRAKEAEGLLHEVHSDVYALPTTFDDLQKRGLQVDQG
jgi:rhodanese-related sulfurtransferase